MGIGIGLPPSGTIRQVLMQLIIFLIVFLLIIAGAHGIMFERCETNDRRFENSNDQLPTRYLDFDIRFYLDMK